MLSLDQRTFASILTAALLLAPVLAHGQTTIYVDDDAPPGGDGSTWATAYTFDFDGDGDTSERLPFDITGSPRFVDDPLAPDCGLGTPSIVDMGAYERLPGDCGDDNGIARDGDVDLVDYAGFVECVDAPPGEPPGECACFDLDGSGQIDLLDFGVFQVTFTGG